MAGKEGTDQLKKLVKNAVDYALQVKKAKSDDGKISKAEYLGFVDEAISTLTIVSGFGKLKAEILDFSTEDGKELLNYTIGLGVIGDKAEIVIINAVEAVETMIGVYNNNIVPIINVFKD